MNGKELAKEIRGNLKIEVAELKKQGIKEGDLVKVLNWTFEWYE